MFQAFFRLFTPFFIFLILLVNSQWDGIKGIFVAVWNFLKGTLKNYLNVLCNLFGTNLDEVKEFWVNVWTSIKNFFVGIWNGIKNFITGVVNAIKNFFTTIWTGIKNFFVGIWTAIYNSVAEKINLIKTVITVVWNAIHTAISTVLNAIWSVITTVDEADIGRSTFYAHFETKDELLKALCNDIFDHVFSVEIMSEEHHDFSHHSSFRDRITHILYHLQEKQQSIRGLFSGECGEIFLRYLKEYLYQVFDEHITIKDDVPHDYALDLAVSSFAETVRWWLKGHSDYSPEQMTAYFFRCISIL